MKCPDSWVVIKVIGEDTMYKVLAGWSGSYLNGTSWQLNSGIVKVEQNGEYFMFHGSSGSVYRCHKEGYGLRMSTAGIWNTLKERYPEQVELMEENTSWSGLILENVDV